MDYTIIFLAKEVIKLKHKKKPDPEKETMKKGKAMPFKKEMKKKKK